MNGEVSQLDGSQFRLLGSGNGGMNTHRLRVRNEGSCIQLSFQWTSPLGYLAMIISMALAMGVFIASLAYATKYRTKNGFDETSKKGKAESVVVIVIPCILAIFGPAIISYLEQKHFRSINPLIEIDSASGTVSLRNGSTKFSRNQLIGFLIYSEVYRIKWRAFYCCELQAIYNNDGKLTPIFLLGDRGGNADLELLRVLKKFSQQSPIRVFRQKATTTRYEARNNEVKQIV